MQTGVLQTAFTQVLLLETICCDAGVYQMHNKEVHDTEPVAIEEVLASKLLGSMYGACAALQVYTCSTIGNAAPSCFQPTSDWHFTQKVWSLISLGCMKCMAHVTYSSEALS